MRTINFILRDPETRTLQEIELRVDDDLGKRFDDLSAQGYTHEQIFHMWFLDRRVK